jgi:hypothetical protein
MLAAAATAIPAIVSKTATAGEQDPIFALIETHRAATAEYIRLVYIKSDIPMADAEAWLDAEEAESAAYGPMYDAQMELLSTRPTTIAGAAAVLAYVASFWIEGNESSKEGLPIYESYGEDEMLTAGEGFLPMIADALQRLTAVWTMRGPCLGRALPPTVSRLAA